MDEPNPYEPPKSSEPEFHYATDSNPPSAKMLVVAWVAVCVFNLPIPLLFASSIAKDVGRVGMSMAVLALLAAGCWICANARKVAVCVIVGAIPVALSQLFPIAQMFAGLIAMSLGQALGLVVLGNDEFGDHFVNEFGGFIVTLITGTSLMMLSAGVGFLLQRFVLARRRREPAA
jgi:hypothetical protein